MEITSVRIKKIEDKKGQLKAVCSVILDNSFLIRNIKLIRINNKYIVAMPNECVRGKYRDICNPIEQGTREMFNEIIINEYLKTN